MFNFWLVPMLIIHQGSGVKTTETGLISVSWTETGATGRQDRKAKQQAKRGAGSATAACSCSAVLKPVKIDS